MTKKLSELQEAAQSSYRAMQAKYPNVFKNEYCDLAYGEGWNDLVNELCAAIEPLCVPDHISAIQVKEKFGSLRFYMSGSTPEICEHIRKAEEKASITCERTGKPGKLRTDLGWWRVLCDEEYENWKLKQQQIKDKQNG